MKKPELFLLFTILIFAGLLRLHRLNAPVADWHSWRQADTAAVARNFVKFGFHPLHPRFDDLSNIPSGKDNPSGWRMVEFPLYQLIGASLFKFFPALSIEVWLRLITISASVGTILCTYLIVGKLIDRKTALAAAFILAILPYNIYYGRAILPDTFMVFWSVLSLFSFIKWRERENLVNGWLIVWAVVSAVALLVKPVAAFNFLPVLLLLTDRKIFSGKGFFSAIIYLFIAILPFVLWRQWIKNFPEGIPVYTWLFNEGGIRFKGAWFYWMFAERLAKLILGYWGLILFGFGLVVKTAQKEGSFIRLWLLGGLLYVIILARGNVQHDYYQILLIPVISVYAAKGFTFLLSNNALSKYISYPLSAVSLLFMFGFSWYTVRTYYWINRPEIILAGQTADRLLPKNAKVIAPYNGDTSFLFQTNRQGWPIGFEIDKKIAMGATAYVTVSPTDQDLETRDLAKKYTVLVRNDNFAIIDLTKPVKTQ